MKAKSITRSQAKSNSKTNSKKVEVIDLDVDLK